MFQYAITRTVAEHNSFEWGFNPTTSNDYFSGAEQMSIFNIDYGKQHTAKWRELPLGIDKEWYEPVITFNDVDRVDYYPYSPEIFDVKDRTKLVISSCQNAKYYNKEKVRSWFTIKQENIEKSEQVLKECGIVLDKDLCVINCRGGEYIGVNSLFLTKQYWLNALENMMRINPKMKLLVVTEDPVFYSKFFNAPIFHHSILVDYYIINHAQNLVLSNSSFGLFSTWLNINVKNVVYPKWWARWNVSNGYWASSDTWTFAKDDNWLAMDRDGKLFTYKNILEEKKDDHESI
jgi:hypothetical protein